jgi:hypothetical protein
MPLLDLPQPECDGGFTSFEFDMSGKWVLALVGVIIPLTPV